MAQPEWAKPKSLPEVHLYGRFGKAPSVNWSAEELLAEFHEGLERSAARVRAFASADLEQPRGVGKKQLPTSVGGLLVHLADHTQRHTGQIVTTAKVLKAENIPSGSVAVHGLS